MCSAVHINKVLLCAALLIYDLDRCLVSVRMLEETGAVSQTLRPVSV